MQEIELFLVEVTFCLFTGDGKKFNISLSKIPNMRRLFIAGLGDRGQVRFIKILQSQMRFESNINISWV